MPTDPQPSPRPWRVEHKPARPGSPIPAAIYAANGCRLTPIAINADADFDLIVRAVNSFDAMRAALLETASLLQVVSEMIDKGTPPTRHSDSLAAAVLQARAALAKARGEDAR